MILRFAVPFMIAASLSACSSESGSTARMNQALSEARSENQTHAGACARVTDLDAMGNEMQRHEVAMDGVFAGMHDGMNAMAGMHCSMMSSLQTSLDDMQHAEPLHMSQMNAMTDLDSARSSCAEYTSHMTSALDQMDQMMRDDDCGMM